MPMQITNDLSIVSKVNVVVLAVPSFAHGQFLMQCVIALQMGHEGSTFFCHQVCWWQSLTNPRA